MSEIYSNFTDDLNQYLVKEYLEDLGTYHQGFYLCGEDIAIKSEGIAVRLPGATRLGICINYDTMIIADIIFLTRDFIPVVTNKFNMQSFKEKWIGNKIELRDKF